MAEKNFEDMNMDEVATLLVELYADYQHYCSHNEDYSKAVAIAIRTLSD